VYRAASSVCNAENTNMFNALAANSSVYVQHLLLRQGYTDTEVEKV
jgi:hypothetical protein